MKIYIKNMVCHRCKMTIISTLTGLNLHVQQVLLGEADILEDLNQTQLAELDNEIRKSGFEVLNNKKSILVEKIKLLVIQVVHSVDEHPIITNLSTFLSEELQLDYTYIATLFSTDQGITIEKFYLKHRVERIKELLLYQELNITEIARFLHYSSVAHLSNQFKLYTGLKPSQFKKMAHPHRIPLEDI